MKKTILMLGAFALLMSCTDKKQEISDAMESLKKEMDFYQEEVNNKYDNFKKVHEAMGGNVTKDPELEAFEKEVNAKQASFQRRSDSLVNELEKLK